LAAGLNMLAPKRTSDLRFLSGANFFTRPVGGGGRVPAPLAPPRPLWGRRHPFFLAPNRARENALFFQKNIRPKRKLKSSKRTSELRFPSGANFFYASGGRGGRVPPPPHAPRAAASPVGPAAPFFLAPNRACENALFFQKKIKLPKREIKLAKTDFRITISVGGKFFLRVRWEGGRVPPPPHAPRAAASPVGPAAPLFF